MKKLLFLVFIFLFLLSCESQNCDDKKSEIRSKYGSPEEVSTYDSEGYHNEDWWYWSKGIEYSFTWGTNVDGCEVSKYTFDPIYSILSDSIRVSVNKLKILEEKEYFIDCDICR